MPKSEPPVQERATLGQAAIYLAFDLEPLEPRLERIKGYPLIANNPFRQSDPYDPSPSEEALSLSEAARRVLSLLATGALTADGYPMFLTDCRDTGGDYPIWEIRNPDGSIRQEVFSYIDSLPQRVTIPADFWTLEGVQWAPSFVTADKVQHDAMLHWLEYGKDVAAYSEVTIATEVLQMYARRSVDNSGDIEPTPVSEESTRAPDFRSPYLSFLLRAEEHFAETIANEKIDAVAEWIFAEGKKQVSEGFSKSMAKMMATILRTPKQGKGGNKKVQNMPNL